ncbi:MAG: PQQ-dependent sugar dehydrogenase [Bacteroidia bacterium]|nr:PQQ-dependent sugar dehydrogenase [Bacteroidia bacterium]
MKKAILSLFLALAGAAAVAQYQTTAVITNLAYPVAFTFTPQNRILLTLKSGEIMYYDANYSLIGTFYDLSDSTYNDFERGLLGIEVDPDYSNNGYVYVYYNHRCCNPSPTGTQYLRVVRFTEVSNVGTNPTIIFNQMVSNSIPGNHVGGNIRFRPSEPNQIYITIGELATPANAQLMTNPYGKILRINKNGTIPTSNPYYDDGNPATGNDDRIWTWGHRNAYDFCFSTFNDSLYASENGASTYDEVNYVVKGKNYGWQACEGNFQYNTTTPCTNPAYTNPIAVFGAPLPAVTGILHYTSSVIPALTNHLLVADNDYGRVYDLTLGNAPQYNTVTSQVQLMDLTTSGGLTTLKQGSEGCFYAMKGGYTTSGNITRVCPVGMNVQTPLTGVSDAELFPVPARDHLTVRFFLQENSTVKIIITDLTGRTVLESEEDSGNSGVNERQVPLNDIPSGIYFCTIISRGAPVTLKMNVSR